MLFIEKGVGDLQPDGNLFLGVQIVREVDDGIFRAGILDEVQNSAGDESVSVAPMRGGYVPRLLDVQTAGIQLGDHEGVRFSGYGVDHPEAVLVDGQIEVAVLGRVEIVLALEGRVWGG